MLPNFSTTEGLGDREVFSPGNRGVVRWRGSGGRGVALRTSWSSACLPSGAWGPGVWSVSTKSPTAPGPHVIAYRATLEVPDAVFATVVRWIRQHRKRVDLRPLQRAATCRDQALLVLRCMKDATLIDAAARDITVSKATGYRYFHEAVDVIAEHAPDLADVLDRAQLEGWSHIELDGTLIPTTRLSARTERGNDAWYSGKHKQHGGNLQVSSTTRTGSRSGCPRSSPVRLTTSPPRGDTCSRG